MEKLYLYLEVAFRRDDVFELYGRFSFRFGDLINPIRTVQDTYSHQILSAIDWNPQPAAPTDARHMKSSSVVA